MGKPEAKSKEESPGSSLCQRLFEILQKRFFCPAHSLDHILRVYNLCMAIAAKEKGVDLEILQAAALLHDAMRESEDKEAKGSSSQTCHAALGAEAAPGILREIGFPEEKIKAVQHCILSHRYREGRKPETIEAKILFDADKLDALGAIGVARSFVWVGHNRAHIYRDINIGQYARENLGGTRSGRIQDKTQHAHNIEFETKLRYLPGKMHTAESKRIARERIEFNRSFIRRLKKEIKGELRPACRLFSIIILNPRIPEICF